MFNSAAMCHLQSHVSSDSTCDGWINFSTVMIVENGLLTTRRHVDTKVEFLEKKVLLHLVSEVDIWTRRKITQAYMQFKIPPSIIGKMEGNTKKKEHS